MTFRERSGQQMEPSQRRIKHRKAARVVVMAEGKTLLFRDTDPGVAGSSWWVVPGGGIDAGETEIAAAAREVFEETGLRVRADELTGPVARRVVTHGYSDQILIQDEVFFRAEVEPFEVSTEGFTELEKITLLGHGWFTVEELADMEVWPAALPELIATRECLDLGEVEESTVPVTTPID